MAQSIQTSKFGTLDTSGRVPVYMAGAEGDPPPLNMGLSFDVGGKSYTFVPEDRITKGAVSGDRGSLFLGFLDPNLLSSLKNNSEYVDIAGTEFGSFDIGKFISDQMGGSTKGFLAPKDTIDPILAQGLTQYNPSFAGQVTGVGEVGGKPTYLLQSGYVLPNGQQVKTERKIVGYRYSSGGGLLAGLGNEILKAGPILPLALDVVGAAYGLPGIGTAVAGGITAGAIASGDEKTATNYAAQYAAGQLGVGSAVAGATGSTVAGQVAQGTAGGLLAGKNPEQAVTSAVKGVALDSLRPDSGVTVPTEEQALASQQDLQNQLAPYESTIPASTTAFDTTQDISDTSGFDIPSPTPQTPITGNTGGNMATYYDEMNAPATELQDTTPFNYSPEEQQLIYQLSQEAGGTQSINDAYNSLSLAAQQTARDSGLRVGDVLKFFQSNPNLTKGLIGAGVSATGGLLTNQANVEAARISAQAMRDAATTAAEAQKFRPVGVTTRFGASQFGFDPTTGQLTSAGYQLTPELKAMQDRIMALSGQGLTEAEQAAGRYAPLTAGAQGLFGLGQQYLGTQQGAPIGQMAQQYMQSQAGQPLTNLGLGYLAKSPEEAASEYMRSQMDLLAPSRERQLSQLQNQLFNTGRGGLSVGATGVRPGGGQGLRAASPEMEAYYNALAQQDAQLAAGAQQAGQQRAQFGAGLYQQGTGLTQAQQLAGAGLYGQGVGLTQQGQQFGAGLLGSGAGLLGSYTQGLTGAYSPFSTGIGVGSSLESLGQAPLDIGAQLGGRSAQAGGNVGQTLLQGGLLGARTTQAASGVSPFGTALTGLANSPEAQQALAQWINKTTVPDITLRPTGDYK